MFFFCSSGCQTRNCEVTCSTLLRNDCRQVVHTRAYGHVCGLFVVTGARTDITNTESKTAFDLANDAETKAMLQHASECSL